MEITRFERPKARSSDGQFPSLCPLQQEIGDSAFKAYNKGVGLMLGELEQFIKTGREVDEYGGTSRKQNSTIAGWQSLIRLRDEGRIEFAPKEQPDFLARRRGAGENHLLRRH